MNSSANEIPLLLEIDRTQSCIYPFQQNLPFNKLKLFSNTLWSQHDKKKKKNATCSCTALLPINLTLADQDKFLSTVFYT